MRAPIITRPRALIWSMRDVPWWGYLVALAAAGGVLVLAMYVASAFYVLGGLMVLFAIGVHVADRLYWRRRR